MSAKKARSFEIGLPPCILYLEDLDEIFLYVNSLVNAEEKLKIENEEHIFVSVEDLKESMSGKTLHELSIGIGERFRSRLNLDFRSYRSSITVSNSDDNAAMGVASKIQSFIRSKASKVRHLYFAYYLNTNPKLAWIGWMIVVVTPGLILKPYNLKQHPLCFLTIIIAVVFFMFLQYRLSFKEYSTVIFYHKNTRKNFLQRNKDQILLAVFAAIFGACVLAVFQNFHIIKQ